LTNLLHRPPDVYTGSEMTDLDGVRSKPGKRERLVAAACQQFHRQGVETTTLADIAQAADVPVGNIYYYFKTKNELVGAVIDAYSVDLRARLSTFDRHRTPKARLKALVRDQADQGALAAQFGCPMGTLCSELDKRADDLEWATAELLTISVDWTEQQFRAMGRSDARDLAVALVAAFQGISLLTNTLRDPELMAREARRLDRWIDSLA
jgi:TetR/AcrR family transcriptional regulator, transcriptional repressor for nem operon